MTDNESGERRLPFDLHRRELLAVVTTATMSGTAGCSLPIVDDLTNGGGGDDEDDDTPTPTATVGGETNQYGVQGYGEHGYGGVAR